MTSGSIAGSGSATREGLQAWICGIAFGVASPVTSHPLDTIKSRMQADPRFRTSSAASTARILLAEGGVTALYRGLPPPLFGSALYRSLQFGAYGFTYGAVREEAWATSSVPGSHGLQLRVLLAGAAATTARACIETPLEVWKVRRQLNRPVWLQGAGWADCLREAYTGFGLTWTRLYLALGSFFVLCDYADRLHPSLFLTPVVGPFMKGGVAATLGWWLAWPFEVLKSQAQCSAGAVNQPWFVRMRAIVRERGVIGMYRGIGPGTARSLIGNGSAMAAYSVCKQCFAPAGG